MTPENLLHPSLISHKCTVGCPVLDRCLGGGIPCNSVTEIVAESGSGKTQFCLQLVLAAQLPQSHGGLSASSLYIHTEFPFPFRRLRQLSHAFRSKHNSLLVSDTSGDPCDRIFVQGVYCVDQLLDLMPKIESFLGNSKSNFPVRLMVIDSIAALFRSEFDNTPLDLKRRSALFFKISGKLKYFAKRFKLAVLVTNQVVDFIGGSEGINGLRVGNLCSFHSSGRRVCPALGLAWANCINSRLFLSRSEEVTPMEKGLVDEDGDVSAHQYRKTRRRLYVVFAPHLPETSCEFVIQREGISGVEKAQCSSGKTEIT